MKVDNEAVQVEKLPGLQTGRYKQNKSYIFTDDNITLLTDNPFKVFRLRRVEDISSKKEVYEERARCEGHVRYQKNKLRGDLGLEIDYKVISRWYVDTGFVEVYVMNKTMKPGMALGSNNG